MENAHNDAELKSRMNSDFPKKRISAGGLIRNQKGELLILKPTYRESWLLPGGICEADESPAHALWREVDEELGLLAKIELLLCIDYLSPTDGFGECIHFLFQCRPLSITEIDKIQLSHSEISSYRFCDDEEAYMLLVPAITRRLKRLVKGSIVYHENGKSVLPFPYVDT